MSWNFRRGRPPKQPPVHSATIEVPLGSRRVLHVQRLDELVRLTTGHRIGRAASEAVQTSGTVLMPVARLPDVLQALRKLTRAKVTRQR